MRILNGAAAIIAIALLAACSGAGAPPVTQQLPGTTQQNQNAFPSMEDAQDAALQSMANVARVCPPPRPGEASCLSLIRTDISEHALPDVAGYGPGQLQSAYKLPSTTKGGGQTVAIVDAFNDPNAEKDLGVYRKNFGLTACTTANGCFRKVNQTGGTKYPPNDPGWGLEMSLDLDMASAVCPRCHILLVEATSNSFSNLGKAVSEAAKLHANVISNSYGGSEYGASDPNYSHPGTVITASAGDNGYGPQEPCTFQTVVCIGGTTLTKSTTVARGWKETVWSGTGSGCSAIVAKPSWQTDTGCRRRTASDTSADANPNTGVALYDSYGYGGWNVVGGTSVSSPIIAAVYALAGNASTQTAAKGIWNNAGKNLFDVTLGSNGGCTPAYLCHGEKGYDGPTGWGTPNGVTAY